MNVHAHRSSLEVAYLLRTATAADAAALHALIGAHRDEGHLLPRYEDEIRTRAGGFVVAEVDGVIRACAELVKLSDQMAELRSLVVSTELRRHGVASRLVDLLQERAAAAGFHTLLALAHDPHFFIRHGFSLVPHEWLAEKIARDCSRCALFRRCGQHALLRSVSAGRTSSRPVLQSRPAAAVA